MGLSLDGSGGASAIRGNVLALPCYLGLGTCFVLFALMLDRSPGLSKALAKHRRMIGLLSGALLIAIGGPHDRDTVGPDERVAAQDLNL